MDYQELFRKTLVSYDTSYGASDKFYYTLPYEKDYDLCDWRPLRMFSGNVIKSYAYKVDEPVVLITDVE